MIFTDNPKQIRVMFMPFRDGLQSSFGGKVRLADILPAMEFAAKEADALAVEYALAKARGEPLPAVDRLVLISPAIGVSSTRSAS